MYFYYFNSLIATFLLPILASAVPYSSYILAPSSRTLRPIAVHAINGTVTSASSLVAPSFDKPLSAPGHAVFSGSGSNVTFDYGQNIEGVASIRVGPSSKAGSRIGVTFSESSMWIAGFASDATADHGLDEVLWFTVVDGQQWYNASSEHLRGGFRYLSVVTPMAQQADLTVVDVVTQFTAMPHLKETQLKNYTGWFHSNDEKVNRVWYAGGYTLLVPIYSGHFLQSKPLTTDRGLHKLHVYHQSQDRKQSGAFGSCHVQLHIPRK